MTLYPVGLMVALAALVGSAHHLKQPLSSYYDFVAFLMVFGGTLAVALITLPWESKRDILEGFKRLFVHRKPHPADVVKAALSLVENPAAPVVGSGVPALAKKVLVDGAELIQLGLPQDRIEFILRERVFHHGKRLRRVANSVRSLAKYPPAFGLAGTVLGLVSLMRAISGGLTAKQTGAEMAVALVATMYGLLAANLIVNPAGEMILKKSQEEEELSEIAIQGVVLAASHSTVLEAQEILNSFVADDERVGLDDVALREAA